MFIYLHNFHHFLQLRWAWKDSRHFASYYWKFAATNQKPYPDLGSDALSAQDFGTRNTDGMLSMSEKCELGVMETSTERQRGETVSLIILQLKYP